jgi:hypothetical protein
MPEMGTLGGMGDNDLNSYALNDVCAPVAWGQEGRNFRMLTHTMQRRLRRTVVPSRTLGNMRVVRRIKYECPE